MAVMKKYIPVVFCPPNNENQKVELEQWNASHNENLAFRHYFEGEKIGLTACAYEDFCVDRDGSYTKAVIERFGFERTMYMLANTVKHKEYDGRFSHEIKMWANFICEGTPSDITRQYMLDRTNPGILDIVAKRVRRMYEEFQLSELGNEATEELDSERVRDLFSKALNWIGETERDFDLYETLHATLGMTNEEIETVGFSLKEYYGPHEMGTAPQDDMHM